MTPARKGISTPNDLQKANELNKFYLRFENQTSVNYDMGEMCSVNSDARLVTDPNAKCSLFLRTLTPKKPQVLMAYLLFC